MLLLNNDDVAKVLTMADTMAALEAAYLQLAQFFAVAGEVYESAKAEGLGREIPTEWLLQDIRN